jgi:hypothetical protein
MPCQGTTTGLNLSSCALWLAYFWFLSYFRGHHCLFQKELGYIWVIIGLFGFSSEHIVQCIYCMFPASSKEEDLERNMLTALDSVPIESMTLIGRFNFSSTIYSEKCCLFVRHFSLKKMVKFSKLFLPLFNFLLSFSPRTRKVVKMFWVFHLVSSWKIDGKQTTFFTEDSAENFEFSNQWQVPKFSTQFDSHQ